MELSLCSQGDDNYLKKYLFNLKTYRTDGLILQVHHSYTDSDRERKRSRFIHAAFNDYGNHLAVADHKGNIFIIDLEMEKYWQLPNFGLLTLLSFCILRRQELLIGLDTTDILMIHAETGNITGVLNGHSVPATEVSYSDNGYYCLTSCSAEAIVWDSSSHNQIHRLSLRLETTLKKVLFMPVTNHIVACFQDDTMNVWKFGSFECVKQIIPETWKTHNLKAIALTKNGRAMVIGGCTPNLVIFCLDTWVIRKVVEFPENISGVKHLEFLSQSFDGGANKVLVMLTTSLEVYFFDIESSVFLKGMYQIFGITAKITLSSNGKYLACTLTTGEVNIYTIEKVVSQFSNYEESFPTLPKDSSNCLASRNYSNYSKKTQRSSESLSTIQSQLKEVLHVKKLLPILKQFGEYPDSYRILIWKTVLQLPGNQESFISLSFKKCHPSYTNLESKYPLVNKSLCNSLKKLLSNLSHWCPLFGEVDFLPEFVFPFVKLFHSDPLASFETVATVIVNWCQNWFEFYPFPPINMLSMMENILGFHDPDLLEFYIENNITSSISVCPLFHTVFSEVLSKAEWLKLWDHVLSNEPSFLFMAIVAYNVVCRNAIKSFHDAEEVEKFFHKQNPIDMKQFLSKTYSYLKETPDEIHSRQFFGPFRSLSSGGTYISFLAYPKLIVDSSAEKLQSIRKEEEEILEEQMKALSLKKKLDSKLKVDTKVEEQEKLYRELEEKLRKTVEEEEDRIITQRQRLRNLRQELRLKELEVLEDTRDKALRERFKKKEMEFEWLLRDISKRKAREKAEVDVMEEEIRKYYSELLLRKCQLEIELACSDGEGDVGSHLEKHREKLKEDLLELQNEWESLQHTKRIDISNKMASIKGLINDVESKVAKEKIEKQFSGNLEGKPASMEKLKRRVKTLEDEIEKLIKENLNRVQKKQEELRSSSWKASAREEVARRRNRKTDSSTSPESCPNCCKSGGDTGGSKVFKSVKSKVSRGGRIRGRKITLIRSSQGGFKSKSKEFEDAEQSKKSPSKTVSSFKVTSPKLGQPLLRSKYTFRTDLNRNDYRNRVRGGGLEKVEIRTSESEPCEMRGFQEAREDWGWTRKSTKGSGECEKAVHLTNFISEEDSSLVGSESENEILKSAMKTRKEIIEKAKRKQRL